MDLNNINLLEFNDFVDSLGIDKKKLQVVLKDLNGKIDEKKRELNCFRYPYRGGEDGQKHAVITNKINELESFKKIVKKKIRELSAKKTPPLLPENAMNELQQILNNLQQKKWKIDTVIFPMSWNENLEYLRQILAYLKAKYQLKIALNTIALHFFQIKKLPNKRSTQKGDNEPLKQRSLNEILPTL